jgi:hypothetical protein
MVKIFWRSLQIENIQNPVKNDASRGGGDNRKKISPKEWKGL